MVHGWLVLFDHGEFGGGIEWYAESGGKPRSITIGEQSEDDLNAQNVNRAVAKGGALYVLQGLSHLGLSAGQLAVVWPEHDHFTSRVIARYDSGVWAVEGEPPMMTRYDRMLADIMRVVGEKQGCSMNFIESEVEGKAATKRGVVADLVRSGALQCADRRYFVGRGTR